MRHIAWNRLDSIFNPPETVVAVVVVVVVAGATVVAEAVIKTQAN